MHLPMLENVAIERPLNAVAAGTTDQTSAAIDMQNWDGVLIIGAFGTLTATQVTSMYVRQDDATGGSYADLLGTSSGALADGDSNKIICIDIYRPRKRFLKAVIDRGTANAVIDGIIAIKYRGRRAPFTQAAVVAKSETHASPAEGTP